MRRVVEVHARIIVDQPTKELLVGAEVHASRPVVDAETGKVAAIVADAAHRAQALRHIERPSHIGPAIWTVHRKLAELVRSLD